MADYKSGDVVTVDVGVFVASRDRGKEFRECLVLEDSKDQQVYVSPRGHGSPMYVFLKDVKSLVRRDSEAHPTGEGK
jgi:hypothetical protein